MLKRFLKNQDGNFAMIFALVSLPIMLGVGAAMDYSGVSREQGRLQNTLDAAILAVGTDFNTMKKSEIRALMKDYLKSNLPPNEYRQIKKLNINLDKRKNSLTATAKGKSDTSFMMLAGIDKLEYDAASQIKSGSGGAEIVLVLDNTASMNQENKLDDLKSAANAFTDAVMPSADGGIVKIGIVPFSNHVNVGLSRRNESWLQVDADSTTTDPNHCSMKRDLISESNCRNATGYSDGVPYTYQQCDRTYGDPYEVCEPRTTSLTWNGCVGSRKEPLNLEDRRYGAVKVPGLMNVSCGSEITPLTNKKSTITGDISAMNGNGSTYIPSGLTWGMRLLSDNAPFSEAVSKSRAAKRQIRKFLILMTDGDNTASAQLPDNPKHWGSDTVQANEWTTIACNNIKAEDISVYTITFGTLLPQTKTLIEDCATSSGQYFHAESGKELKKAFEDIRKQIMDLHLSM